VNDGARDPAQATPAHPNLLVAVCTETLDTAACDGALRAAAPQAGALVAFTGLVRGDRDGTPLHALELEHYPGMTEQSMHASLAKAVERWPVLAVHARHRVGRLLPGETIVWVGVAARHRAAAFAAGEFVMDFLKTRAILWKREWDDTGGHWVEATAEDRQREQRWQGRASSGNTHR